MIHLLEVVIIVSTISAQKIGLPLTPLMPTPRESPPCQNLKIKISKRKKGERKGDDFLYLAEVIVSGGKIKFIRGSAEYLKIDNFILNNYIS